MPTSGTFSSLALTQGKGYYVIIRAYNGVGLFEDGYSVLVIPDATPPTPGDVFDGQTPEVDIDYQADSKHVYGSWTKFPEADTAIKCYYYAVGSCLTGNYHLTENQFIPVNPPTARSFLLTNISLVNGQQYCITVMAENKAGLLSLKVSSDGFLIDLTPPNVRKAQVQDGNTGSDIDYQANNTALSAEWSGIIDPESGIQSYEYGVSWCT